MSSFCAYLYVDGAYHGIVYICCIVLSLVSLLECALPGGWPHPRMITHTCSWSASLGELLCSVVELSPTLDRCVRLPVSFPARCLLVWGCHSVKYKRLPLCSSCRSVETGGQRAWVLGTLGSRVSEHRHWEKTLHGSRESARGFIVVYICNTVNKDTASFEEFFGLGPAQIVTPESWASQWSPAGLLKKPHS